MKIDYTVRFYLTLAAVVAIGAAWFYRHDLTSLDFGRATKAPVVAVDSGKGGAARKILYWTDPMIPGYRAEGPGKSPMGMDLTPVYEGELETGVAITVSPEMTRNLGVRTAPVVERRIDKTVRASGVVAYDETRVANVQAKVSGWVEHLYVNYTGQRVKKGDFLLEIYSPELVATEEEFLLAVKNRTTAHAGAGMDTPMTGEAMYQAARNRLRYLDVPEHQIQELETTREIKKTLHIHSPFDGVVVEKMVTAGMQAAPGMTLYRVADLSRVWVMADVYEYELGWVRPGMRAESRLPAYPGRVFKGTVSYIYPVMEKETRTVKVRIEFDNPGDAMKPEMYAQTTIFSGGRGKSLAVPAEAVIRTGRKDVVIVAMEGGRFAPREVTVGVEGDGYYEIESGLYKGERVVTSAQFLIDSESSIREATAKMVPPGAAPAPAPREAEGGAGLPAPVESKGMEHNHGHSRGGGQ